MNSYIIQTNMKAHNFTLIVQGINESDACEKAISMWMDHIVIPENFNHMNRSQPIYRNANGEMYCLVNENTHDIFNDEKIDVNDIAEDENMDMLKAIARMNITKWISTAKVFVLTPTSLVYSYTG